MRPYLRVANVYEDQIDISDVKEMNFTPEEYEKFALAPGDILLNEGQSPELVGRPAMYRGELPDACFQMTLLRFRSGPEVEPEFALIVFRHYLHSGVFRRVARWSTNIAHLSRKRLVELPFPLPPLNEQIEIAAEARRRLTDSADQAAAVRASLDRVPSMLAELLAAATSGHLVPQHDDDEPADVLLHRVGPPPTDAGLVERPIKGQESREQTVAMALPNGRDIDGTDAAANRLAAVLRNAGRALALPELFSLAGYNRDSIADVEEFYLALRAATGTTIRQVNGAQENAMLEAIPDAPR